MHPRKEGRPGRNDRSTNVLVGPSLTDGARRRNLEAADVDPDRLSDARTCSISAALPLLIATDMFR